MQNPRQSQLWTGQPLWQSEETGTQAQRDSGWSGGSLQDGRSLNPSPLLGDASTQRVPQLGLWTLYRRATFLRLSTEEKPTLIE